MTTTGATPRTWDDEDVAATRFHRHGLAGAAQDVAAAARRSAALQAQDLAATRLQVRPRTHALTADDVTRACDEGDVVRTWLMRGTLHLVPAADVAWLVRLLGPPRSAATGGAASPSGSTTPSAAAHWTRCPRCSPAARSRAPRSLAALAGPASGCRRSARRRRISSCSPRPRPGLPRPGRRHGAHLRPPRAVGPHHRRARGTRGRRGARPPAPRGLRAGRRRGPRGVGGHRARRRPAGAGRPGRRARRVATARGPLWVPADQREPDPAPAPAGASCRPSTPTSSATPTAPPLLDPARATRVNAGGGWLHPVAVRGGRVAGTWRLRRRGAGHVAAVELFDGPPDDAAATALEAEADDVGRFLGADVDLEFAGG